MNKVKEMPIKIVDGNVLSDNVDAKIICHQTNFYGVMGAGLAVQIKNKYPNVFRDYKSLCDSHKNEPTDLLGTVQFVETLTDGKVIANAFSQNDMSFSRCVTDYAAVVQCMESIADRNETVAIPYKYGCGIAGGDWDIVYDIICKVFKGKEDMVTIYRYNPNM